MASELYVETLKGLTSGANANKVIIPSGQTLDATITGFSITVTPSSVDSEFIIESFPHAYLSTGVAGEWTGLNLRVTRSVSGQSDVVLGGGGSGNQFQFANRSVTASAAVDMGNGMLIIKDEPNTTSSVTYVGTASVIDTAATDVVVNRYGSGFFRVTEIAG
jgi:hypothetical protein